MLGETGWECVRIRQALLADAQALTSPGIQDSCGKGKIEPYCER
jgi:hypothetical protein